MTDWNLQRARETYSIAHWSEGYFDINDTGQVVVRPQRQSHSEVALTHIIDEVHRSELTLPVLLRFPGILRDRVTSLCQAFNQAMQQNAYRGQYCAVYPIKVNQQRTVIEEIVASHQQVGLEAGSKPELMIVLAQAAGSAGATIVCNGYKDREYIRLALIGRLLGYRIYIVVEKLSELDMIISEARDLAVQPLIGIRARLSSLGKGNWQNTGGEKSKFGLSSAQMLAMIKRLTEENLLASLQLLHVHLGSQVANIRDIQRGMQEAARCYAELHSLGVPLQVMDVGGGLGIDYEGTRSRSYCSTNYSMQEYANNVVRTIVDICDAQQLPQPDIFTESGRAMTAHHAVLVTNVIDAEQQPETLSGLMNAAQLDDEPLVIRELYHGLSDVQTQAQPRSVVEMYHDAQHGLALARDMFVHGVLSLPQRALAEQIYFATCHKIRPLLQSTSRMHREILEELNEQLADKYFCNFSLFQSLPDVWAINQVFPLMPLQRLTEAPERRAVISDITCDSDGRIDLYVDNEGLDTSLPLHQIKTGEPYWLGIFLIGAYQEILGDMHNLFGDTHAVNVDVADDGNYRLVATMQGDGVDSVLRYVNYDVDQLLRSYEQRVAAAPLTAEQRASCLQELQAGLSGYTYLED